MPKLDNLQVTVGNQKRTDSLKHYISVDRCASNHGEGEILREAPGGVPSHHLHPAGPLLHEAGGGVGGEFCMASEAAHGGEDA